MDTSNMRAANLLCAIKVRNKGIKINNNLSYHHINNNLTFHIITFNLSVWIWDIIMKLI